jgi:hypothetical protein
MGLFETTCPSCKNPTIWFSGNPAQNCVDCNKYITFNSPVPHDQLIKPEVKASSTTTSTDVSLENYKWDTSTWIKTQSLDKIEVSDEPKVNSLDVPFGESSSKSLENYKWWIDLPSYHKKEKESGPTEETKVEPSVIPKKLADRYNEDKLRWHNVPLWMFEDIIKVGQFGEKKYSSFNFLKSFPITELQNSALRHLAAFDNPFQPDTDKESNESHLAHCAWNIIVMLYVMKHHPEMDDRYKVPKEDSDV